MVVYWSGDLEDLIWPLRGYGNEPLRKIPDLPGWAMTWATECTGISVGTLHWYYLNKQALLYTVLNIKRLTFTSVRQEHFS
jgi:hypothetical protein